MGGKNIWLDNSISNNYLSGVRAAIPFAVEEINILIRIIKQSQSNVSNILDLGCGDGILGRAVWKHFKQASISFMDMSENMIKAAEIKVKEDSIETPCQFFVYDLADTDWVNIFPENQPKTFDVIVSGLAIHHLTHQRKKEIYHEIYQLLSPGGIFLNLERVESRSNFGIELNDNMYIDSLTAFHQKNHPEMSRDEIAHKFYYDPLKQSNILESVEVQCDMLREIGYQDVDIFFKIFEIAIFGGIKPKNA